MYGLSQKNPCYEVRKQSEYYIRVRVEANRCGLGLTAPILEPYFMYCAPNLRLLPLPMKLKIK